MVLWRKTVLLAKSPASHDPMYRPSLRDTNLFCHLLLYWIISLAFSCYITSPQRMDKLSVWFHLGLGFGRTLYWISRCGCLSSCCSSIHFMTFGFSSTIIALCWGSGVTKGLWQAVLLVEVFLITVAYNKSHPSGPKSQFLRFIFSSYNMCRD